MPDNVALITSGTKELRAAFKEAGVKLGPQLRRGFKTIADRIATDIVGQLPGSLKSAVKAKATATGAGIAFPRGEERGAQDFYPWFDFGGTTGRGHRVGQRFSGSISRPWMGNPAGEGRFVYPTIRKHRAETERMVGEMLDQVARGAGFEVRE